MQHLFLDNILKARIANGTLTEVGNDDVGECTNMYLAGLFSAFTQPEFGERMLRFVKKTDMEVSELVDTKDMRLNYNVYKTNAEYLLFHFTFGNYKIEKENWHDWTPENKKGLCSSYYSITSGYAEQIAQNPIMSKVFRNISDQIEKYVDLVRKTKEIAEKDAPFLRYGEDGSEERIFDQFLVKYKKFNESPSKETALDVRKCITFLKETGNYDFTKPEKKIDAYIPKIISLEDLM